jgi:predicted Zn-dependent protease with MMP-like domain
MPEDTLAGEAARDDPFRVGIGLGDAPDYYAVLGLRPGASEDEIRRAFHRLAKLWHPDRYLTAPPELRRRAERRMRTLTAAHRALGDPRRRETYDRLHGYSVPGERADEAAAGSAAHRWHAAQPGARGYQRAAAARAAGGDRWRACTTMASLSGREPTESFAGDVRGAGTFLGLICSVLAIGLVGAALGQGGGGFGADVAIGAGLLLGGLALWCFRAESPPARLASHWLEGEPAAYAAARRSADRGPTSSDTDQDAFVRLVERALASVPAQFQKHLANVVVRVEAEPTAEQLASAGAREGGLLLGLYEGVDLTRQGVAGAGPEVITVFQGPIERYCHGDPRRICRQVRRTVLHELAHHFGIDHEDMPAWVR